MSSSGLLKILGLKKDADISVAGTRFIENIREYVSFVENNPPTENVEKQSLEISVLYKSFFPFANQWASTEREKRNREENHPEALSLKEKGEAAREDLQNNIISFAVCYMRIHWVLGLITQEVKNTPEPESKKDVQWTSETGVMLAKYRKRRAELINSNEKLADVLKILEAIEPDRIAFERNAAELYGEEFASKSLSSYRSGLRTGNFEKARKALTALVEGKKKFAFDKKKMAEKEEAMRKAGEKYIADIEKHQDVLKAGDEKIYLKASEVSVITHAHDQEMKKVEAFIKKYFRPALNYQIKTLHYLRTKLLVLGSLESLMTLYIRMMRGIAEPMKDVKEVRLYESEVIEHVMYLLGGQFQEVVNIENRIEQILKEFRTCVQEYDTVKN